MTDLRGRVHVVPAPVSVAVAQRSVAYVCTVHPVGYGQSAAREPQNDGEVLALLVAVALDILTLPNAVSRQPLSETAISMIVNSPVSAYV